MNESKGLLASVQCKVLVSVEVNFLKKLLSALNHEHEWCMIYWMYQTKNTVGNYSTMFIQFSQLLISRNNSHTCESGNIHFISENGCHLHERTLKLQHSHSSIKLGSNTVLFCLAFLIITTSNIFHIYMISIYI